MIDPTDWAARERRLDRLIAAVPKMLDHVTRRYITDFRDGRGRPRVLAGTITMFSGGNDSTVLAHLMRPYTNYYGHANTGIGIEATRQFVRDTAASWGIPLIERSPKQGRTYAEYVSEHGFPGPGRHGKVYARIKGSPFEQINAELCPNPYKQRAIFVAGRRFTESARREQRRIPVWEHRKSVVWLSPMRGWTALDLNTYRRRFPDCPTNQVAAELGMSGECLCGAFARPDELAGLRCYPPAVEAVKEIDRLAAVAEGRGVPNVWGRRPVDRPCGEGCNL